MIDKWCSRICKSKAQPILIPWIIYLIWSKITFISTDLKFNENLANTVSLHYLMRIWFTLISLHYILYKWNGIFNSGFDLFMRYKTSKNISRNNLKKNVFIEDEKAFSFYTLRN
jgi:hypothetical protein